MLYTTYMFRIGAAESRRFYLLTYDGADINNERTEYEGAGHDERKFRLDNVPPPRPCGPLETHKGGFLSPVLGSVPLLVLCRSRAFSDTQANSVSHCGAHSAALSAMGTDTNASSTPTYARFFMAFLGRMADTMAMTAR